MKKTGFDEGRFDFVGKSKFFAVLSGVAVVASLALIQVKGLNYGIDFAGGTEIQVKFNQPPSDDGQVRKFLTQLGLADASVQRFGSDAEYLIRFGTIGNLSEEESNRRQNETAKQVTTGLQGEFATLGPEIRRVDSVGPQVGSQLKRNGVLATFYSLIAILIYVGLRFDYKFAPGAVLCLFHDALITVGLFALLGKEVNIQILAAVLTIIGYSINDTIVVYDRIREVMVENPGISMGKVINKATNETLSRTILTSTTTFLAVGALFFLAGGVIEDFAFAMLIGIFIGAYSTIYVASPSIILFEKTFAKKAA